MIRLLTCLFLFVAVARLCAVELLAPPQVTTTAGSATITWRTDVECGTRVSFGLLPNLLDGKAEGPVTAEHSVTLKELRPDTTYHYAVGSARTRLAVGSFATRGKNTTDEATAKSGQSLIERLFRKPAASAPKSPAVPPTRETWGHLDTLQDHYDRHGQDFQSRTPDDYAAQAWLFLQRARAEALPMKLDKSDGTLRVFDPKTRAFAAYNRDGTTKTYFRPNNPAYWQRQPGLPIQPSQLRFK